ncbi:MAG: hypothetical protein JO186_04210 [Actinobacteria bacterium]|nr:hypothetical protein [Actinomycetota bacterium]MBV8394636.1 hypothetical protein [Actinomycetota bacterium]MBV8599191.1 hypothetical protein [Actinomycetota bacterium]
MLRRLVHEESGVALVFALITIVVLSGLATAVSMEVTVNERNAGQSAAGDRAFALAELGMSYAAGYVYNANATHVRPSTSSTTFSQDGGSVTYYASTSDNVNFVATGVGTYSGVTRTVTEQINDPLPVQTPNQTAWNYLYASNPSGCTNLSGGVTVSVPFFTNGDFCLAGGSHFTGTQLQVGGNLTLAGGSNVGTSGTKLTTLNIVGASCTDNGTTVTTGTGVCDGNHASIYATSVGRTLNPSLTMPTANFASTYSTQAGLTATGCPAGLLDGNGVMDNSQVTATLTSALFSASSYDCKVGSNEIKWTPSGTCGSGASGTMQVTGTFYFDGSLDDKCGSVVYSGQASFYFTGGVKFEGGSTFCGITNCTASWNPDTNGIIMVADCWANSTGSVQITTKCAYDTGGSTIQIGLYDTTDYEIDGGATNMGPVLSTTMALAGGSSTLIPFHTMPPGTPLNYDTSYPAASTPTNWNG